MCSVNAGLKQMDARDDLEIVLTRYVRASAVLLILWYF